LFESANNNTANPLQYKIRIYSYTFSMLLFRRNINHMFDNGFLINESFNKFLEYYNKSSLGSSFLNPSIAGQMNPTSV
jgi:hypothetical protein